MTIIIKEEKTDNKPIYLATHLELMREILLKLNQQEKDIKKLKAVISCSKKARS